MSTVSIRYCDIPTWLHAGDFYRSLSPDDPKDETIEIPADCFPKFVPFVIGYYFNLELFRQHVRIAMYWMLDEIPENILEVCARHKAEEWQNAMLSVPGAEESRILAPLLGVYPFQDKIPFEIIIQSGKLELIVHAAKYLKAFGATIIAAQVGDLRVFQHLHEQGFQWNERTCARASEDGHLSCLQYARENGCPWDKDVYLGAALMGHLHCLQYAHQQGLEWSHDVSINAAFGGFLPCLQFVHETGCPWDSMAVRSAAEAGSLECLQYLLQEGCPIHEHACDMACLEGHLSCLQLLSAYYAPWNENTSFHAAQSPDISCLQYLHEHGCSWDAATPFKAAQAGQLAPLRYALEHGCVYSEGLVSGASSSGSPECLEYVVEDQLLLMNEYAFGCALLRGNLQCLQYLIDQGCPYVDTSFSNDSFAVSTYDIMFVQNNPEFTHCVRYAVERGWNVDAAFCKFVVTRDVACTAYLRSEGLFIEEILAPLEENSLYRAAIGGQVDALRSLFDRGCPYGDDILEYAAISCNIACLQYLVKEQMLSLNEEVFIYALCTGNLPCVQYLIDHGCPYLAAIYSAENNPIEDNEALFVPHNPQFTQCVRYAVERGWKITKEFCRYVSRKQGSCAEYLKYEGLYVDE